MLLKLKKRLRRAQKRDPSSRRALSPNFRRPMINNRDVSTMLASQEERLLLRVAAPVPQESQIANVVSRVIRDFSQPKISHLDICGSFRSVDQRQPHNP